MQHGPAWKPKCEDLLNKKLISGIIWDFRNESIEKINEVIKEDSRINRLCNMADMKIYYKQFPNSLLKKASELEYMPNYHLNRINLRDRENLEKIVDDTIDFQRKSELNLICIPALYISSFDERMVDAIFDLTVEYIKRIKVNEEKLFLNMIVHESAFENKNHLEDFLNELSSYKSKIQGVYITVDRENANAIRHDYNPTRLSNLMQLIYDLKLMNLEVIVGYSGIESINLIAAGADHIATGWFHSLRKFNKEEKGLEPIDARGRQKKRYTSINFLSELIIDENIWQYNPTKKDWLFNNVLNGYGLDEKIKNENLDDISLNETYLEYFESLNEMFNMIKNEEVEIRFKKLNELIDKAIKNIDEYNKDALLLKLTKKHLENYKLAISKFANNNFIDIE
jgi:hypothetical protein